MNKLTFLFLITVASADATAATSEQIQELVAMAPLEVGAYETCIRKAYDEADVSTDRSTALYDSIESCDSEKADLLAVYPLEDQEFVDATIWQVLARFFPNHNL